MWCFGKSKILRLDKLLKAMTKVFAVTIRAVFSDERLTTVKSALLQTLRRKTYHDQPLLIKLYMFSLHGFL